MDGNLLKSSQAPIEELKGDVTGRSIDFTDLCLCLDSTPPIIEELFGTTGNLIDESRRLCLLTSFGFSGCH